MSQGNVELAQRLVRAVAEQDLARLLQLTDPDVEWHSFLAELNEGQVYRGHDGIRQYVKDLEDSWEFLQAEIDDTLAIGEVAVVVGRLRYRGKGSGVEFETPTGYMLKARGGRALLLRAFREPEEALQAVGLSE